MDIINSSPAMIPQTTPSIVVLPQPAAAKQQTTASTQTQRSPQPQAMGQPHATTPPALTDLPLATAPATQPARQPLPLPTQGKREVADEITQGSSPKQARTTERESHSSKQTWDSSGATNNKDEDITSHSHNKERTEDRSNTKWGWTGDQSRKDSSGTLGEQHRRFRQRTNNRRNEARDQVNEGTRSVHRSTHKSTHTRATQEYYQVKMGSSTERQHSSSTNCSKGLHRGDQWQRRHLRVNTNPLRSEDATRLGTLQQLDLSHKRHFNSLSTCSSSNSRSFHVSTSRVLQRLRPDRLAAQQSHLWLTQQPKSMAKSLGRGDATTWTTTTCQRAQRLRNTPQGDAYILCYVDDLLFIGQQETVNKLFKSIQQHLLLRPTGELTVGNTISFLGRNICNKGDYYEISLPDSYTTQILEEASMLNCNPAPAPGNNTLKATSEMEQELKEEHAAYRRMVSKLQWMTYRRPDIGFATKELARALTQPTAADQQKLKHLLRHIKGTQHYKQYVRPTTKTPTAEAVPDIQVFVDSDWAGCATTRKLTTGFLIKVFGATIHYGSRTQATIALSSAEAELYAINTGATEALHISNFLKEALNMKKINIRIYTDSSSGKSMATRIGASKKAKHIELKHLFIQQLVAHDLVRIVKINTINNPADIFTKYVAAETLFRHISDVGISTQHHWTNNNKQQQQFHCS